MQMSGTRHLLSKSGLAISCGLVHSGCSAFQRMAAVMRVAGSGGGKACLSMRPATRIFWNQPLDCFGQPASARTLAHRATLKRRDLRPSLPSKEFEHLYVFPY